METLVNVGGWEVLVETGPDRSLNALWALPADARTQQVLMHNRNEASGLIRLVQVTGAAQQRIRPDDQAWDTGGLCALDLRVLDIESTRTALHARGWRAPSDPVRYEAYPGVEVIQWAPLSPDGVRFSFIQRIAPPLEGWPELKHWSRAINAVTMVKEMDVSAKVFAQTLGLPVGGRSKAVGDAGPNVMGLPWSFQRKIATDVLGFRGAGNDGSVELICIPQAQGRDYGAEAYPPNLGLAGLRWLVEDVQSLADRFAAQGRSTRSPIQTAAIAPYGACRVCVFRTVDGVWLEFVQRLS